MISPLLYLRAVNPSKNINRWYSLKMGQDLFGEWLLITQWGWFGFNGQSKEYVFSEEKLAQKKFQIVLDKRLKARARIGCSYEIVEDHYVTSKELPHVTAQYGAWGVLR